MSLVVCFHGPFKPHSIVNDRISGILAMSHSQYHDITEWRALSENSCYSCLFEDFTCLLHRILFVDTKCLDDIAVPPKYGSTVRLFSGDFFFPDLTFNSAVERLRILQWGYSSLKTTRIRPCLR